jgi:hypothetical protein
MGRELRLATGAEITPEMLVTFIDEIQSIQPNPLADVLARTIHESFQRHDPETTDAGWNDLKPSDQELYRTVLEALLVRLAQVLRDTPSAKRKA